MLLLRYFHHFLTNNLLKSIMSIVIRINSSKMLNSINSCINYSNKRILFYYALHLINDHTC